ncbi:MAG: nuclear transport factor 2 family protein [Nocardioidaceae bacterium]
MAIVEQWLAAVNRGDGVRLEQLTHEEVEIVGPRGSGRADRRVLSEWLTRAGFSAEPLRWFCGGDGRVVVEQDARWVDVATGEEQGSRTRGIAVPRRPEPDRQVRAA